MQAQNSAYGLLKPTPEPLTGCSLLTANTLFCIFDVLTEKEPSWVVWTTHDDRQSTLPDLDLRLLASAPHARHDSIRLYRHCLKWEFGFTSLQR